MRNPGEEESVASLSKWKSLPRLFLLFWILWQSLHIISARFLLFSKNTLISSFQPTFECLKISYLFCPCIYFWWEFGFHSLSFPEVNEMDMNSTEKEEQRGWISSLMRRKWSLSLGGQWFPNPRPPRDSKLILQTAFPVKSSMEG